MKSSEINFFKVKIKSRFLTETENSVKNLTETVLKVNKLEETATSVNNLTRTVNKHDNLTEKGYRGQHPNRNCCQGQQP